VNFGIRAVALASLAVIAACATARQETPETSRAPAPALAPPALGESVPPPNDAGAPAQGLEEAWRAPAFGQGVPTAAGEPERGGARVEEPGALDPLRARVVRAAGALVGRRLHTDCSGFVLRVMREAGVEVRLAPARSRSESLYRASRPVEAPRPGDLVFFHNTYDRNHDRRANDRFTHVALVESVEGSAIVLVHRAVHGVERLRMDLARPSDPDANGLLRFHRRADAPGTRYLAGELFAAFGELLGGEFTRMLQASRTSATGARHRATR
jgi:hypothetical protein